MDIRVSSFTDHGHIYIPGTEQPASDMAMWTKRSESHTIQKNTDCVVDEGEKEERADFQFWAVIHHEDWQTFVWFLELCNLTLRFPFRSLKETPHSDLFL